MHGDEFAQPRTHTAGARPSEIVVGCSVVWCGAVWCGVLVCWCVDVGAVFCVVFDVSAVFCVDAVWCGEVVEEAWCVVVLRDVL